jgi:hypothetical protein
LPGAAQLLVRTAPSRLPTGIPPRDSMESTSSSASTTLHSSEQQIDVALQSAYCKCMFQVYKMFQRYVASVLYGCCRARS